MANQTDDWQAALARFCEALRRRFGTYPRGVRLELDDADIELKLPPPTPPAKGCQEGGGKE